METEDSFSIKANYVTHAIEIRIHPPVISEEAIPEIEKALDKFFGEPITEELLSVMRSVIIEILVRHLEPYKESNDGVCNTES